MSPRAKKNPSLSCQTKAATRAEIKGGMEVKVEGMMATRAITRGRRRVRTRATKAGTRAARSSNLPKGQDLSMNLSLRYRLKALSLVSRGKEAGIRVAT